MLWLFLDSFYSPPPSHLQRHHHYHYALPSSTSSITMTISFPLFIDGHFFFFSSFLPLLLLFFFFCFLFLSVIIFFSSHYTLSYSCIFTIGFKFSDHILSLCTQSPNVLVDRAFHDCPQTLNYRTSFMVY